MHFNKYQILTTDKYTKFEHLYKKVKHICVVIFLVVFLIGFIILLSLVLYFQQLTKDASSISDRELKAKILHIPGDELINHNNQILEEYDHSQNTLIVGPNHVNSNIIHALTASEDTLFYKHNGIMPKALLRAMLQDITNSNQSSGGSTITQQLVNNQVRIALTEVWEKGGEGGIELANQVFDVMQEPQNFKHLYELKQPLEAKIETIVKEIYGGSKVNFSSKAQKQLKQFKENGWDEYPICMAKTQYSFSDDQTLLGAPNDFEITIRELEAKTGAGFIVALTGAIMTMPGLPKKPAALNMDVTDDGKAIGLF